MARISQTAHEEFEAAAKRVDKKFRFEKYVNNKSFITASDFFYLKSTH